MYVNVFCIFGHLFVLLTPIVPYTSYVQNFPNMYVCVFFSFYTIANKRKIFMQLVHQIQIYHVLPICWFHLFPRAFGLELIWGWEKRKWSGGPENYQNAGVLINEGPGPSSPMGIAWKLSAVACLSVTLLFIFASIIKTWFSFVIFCGSLVPFHIIVGERESFVHVDSLLTSVLTVWLPPK